MNKMITYITRSSNNSHNRDERGLPFISQGCSSLIPFLHIPATNHNDEMIAFYRVNMPAITEAYRVNDIPAVLLFRELLHTGLTSDCPHQMGVGLLMAHTMSICRLYPMKIRVKSALKGKHRLADLVYHLAVISRLYPHPNILGLHVGIA
jgi:hypothetical protein